MEIKDPDIKIIKRIQRNLSWRIVNIWVLGIAFLFFWGIAILQIILLFAHLKEHGVSISNLFLVLWEVKHPSEIHIDYIFSLSICITMEILLGLNFAIGLLVILFRSKEQMLLLKLSEKYLQEKG